MTTPDTIWPPAAKRWKAEKLCHKVMVPACDIPCGGAAIAQLSTQHGAMRPDLEQPGLPRCSTNATQHEWGDAAGPGAAWPAPLWPTLHSLPGCWPTIDVSVVAVAGGRDSPLPGGAVPQLLDGRPPRARVSRVGHGGGCCGVLESVLEQLESVLCMEEGAVLYNQG